MDPRESGMHRRLVATCTLLLLVVVSASCSGEGRAGDGGASPGRTPGELEFAEGEPCPAAVDPTLRRGSGCVSVVSRDGLTLSVYASLDGDGLPLRWYARVRGPGVDAEGDLGERLDYPRAVGGSDVDLDGGLEWWVEVGDYASHGAPWAYLNLFFVEGASLVPLLSEGKPLPINYGGISRLGEGAECRDGGLVLLRAEAQDDHNTRWKVIKRTLSIDGRDAVFERRRQHTIVVDDYVDPKIRRFFRVECDGEVYLPK